MKTQKRIDELKQCAAWETHVSSLEALALQLDSELCREREAHAKTREELMQAKRDCESTPRRTGTTRRTNQQGLNKMKEEAELAATAPEKPVIQNSRITEPDHLHKWMRLQESINNDIAGELQKLRHEIEAMKAHGN
jgi:hypothetical protein